MVVAGTHSTTPIIVRAGTLRKMRAGSAVQALILMDMDALS